jgi:CcmD family protein
MPTLRRLLLLVLVIAAVSAPVFAQQPQAQNEFVPVRPGDLVDEQIPAARLVLAAYAFVWVSLLAYVVFLWQRLKRIEVELAEVRGKLGGSRR